MIGIVCALKCEADKIIQFYNLKPFPQKTSFPLYYSDSIWLIISGIGKVSSASATCYLYLFSGERIMAWLNVGVGGHAFFDLGEGRLAHQIKDEAVSKVFYPVFTYKSKVKTDTVLTIDRVEKSYMQNLIYEMEASAFFQTASRFATAELIHCYKVISDNKNELPTKNQAKVMDLISHNMTSISQTVDVLLGLLKDLSDANKHPELLPFLERWHFTTTEMHQLRRHLQRWQACHTNKDIWDERLTQLKGAKEVISYLNQKIEACFPSFT